nr:ABC transporter permease [Asticcacaulis solisilvae]
MSEIARSYSVIWRIIGARWLVYLLMVAGLTLAYCAAIVIGLYVRDELSYDRFMPGSDRVYLISASYGPSGQPLVWSDRTPAGVARWMRSDMPEVDQVARFDTVEWPMRTARRHAKERFYWADANLFRVLKLPVLEGDPDTALEKPGSVVMTRRMAIAYFGRADALGQTVTTQYGHRMTLTAVLKDFPANTHLDREIFGAGSSVYSKLYNYDGNGDFLWPNSYTYVTFKPGAKPGILAARLAEIARKRWQGPNNLPDGFALVPLSRLHFQPHGDGELKPRGHLDSVFALIVVAAAIVTLACINFAGLILAERNERTAEHRLHSALGARRIDLIGQVLREALVVHVISAGLGLAAVERLLPTLNAALDIRLDLWTSPLGLLLSISAAVIALALLSGLAPAVLISRPQHGGLDHRNDIASMRWRGWVVAQLALVIVLLTASHTVSRQWSYATQGALGFDGDNVLMVRFSDTPAINAKFMAQVRALPGVVAAAESFGAPTNDFVRPGWTLRAGRPLVSLTRNSTHPDFLRVYDIPILAGHNLAGTFLFPETPREVLINEAAVTALGFRSPEAALGHDVEYETDRTLMRSRIVGVIPNVRVATIYEPMQPMIFDNFSKYFTQVNIRLSTHDREATIARIDALWRQVSEGSVPVERRFFRDYLMQQYHDLHQQMVVFYAVSAVAIMLSSLGLTGLSIFLTRHQVRELAIRKALGATFSDLFFQRFMPFLWPFLLTNLVAWPVAWLCLQGWLKSFAEHVALSPWSFLGAGVVAVGVSLATIALQSAATARDFSVSSSLRHH